MTYVIHYGVKGMKWGVRKEKETPSNTDFTVAKGDKVYNIATTPERKLQGHVFGVHTNLDVLNYRGNFANIMSGPGRTVYSNQLEARVATKVASGKTQAEEFKKLWDTDRETIVEALAVSQRQRKISSAIMYEVFHVDRSDVYRKKIAAKGERWVKNKGALELNTALGSKDGSAVAAKMMRKHYTKLGYNALLDMNDAKSFEAEAPVIYLTPKKSLKSVNTIALSRQDIRAAILAREFKMDRKKYGDVHAIHNPKGRD